MPDDAVASTKKNWMDTHAALAWFTAVLGVATIFLAAATIMLWWTERKHGHDAWQQAALVAKAKLAETIEKYPTYRACARFVVSRDLSLGIPPEQAGIAARIAKKQKPAGDTKSSQIELGTYQSNLATTSLLDAVRESKFLLLDRTDKSFDTNAAHACLDFSGSGLNVQKSVLYMRNQLLSVENAFEDVKDIRRTRELGEELRKEIDDDIDGALNGDFISFMRATVVYYAAANKTVVVEGDPGNVVTEGDLKQALDDFDECGTGETCYVGNVAADPKLAAPFRIHADISRK